MSDLIGAVNPYPYVDSGGHILCTESLPLVALGDSLGDVLADIMKSESRTKETKRIRPEQNKVQDTTHPIRANKAKGKDQAVVHKNGESRIGKHTWCALHHA